MSVALEAIFWVAFVAAAYAYVGYPLVLLALVALRGRRDEFPDPQPLATPSVTMIVPAHNESHIIGNKLANCASLIYPEGQLQIVFVSDASTDGTTELLQRAAGGRVQVIVLSERGGKAAALNAALQQARGEILVFSDASIELRPEALVEIVRPFQSPAIGCVSGEDRVAGGGGEGAYGRYELWLRRQESRLQSIVGASGSFYAQRRSICEPFLTSMAPDFLSVLVTVRKGYRAVSHPGAWGTMTAVAHPGEEFRRKVRTVLRGISTLALHADLLNPFKFGVFAFELVSHKLARWLVPLSLLLMLSTSAMLAGSSRLYATLLLLQVAFYALAAGALTGWEPVAGSLPGRLSLYFTSANVATASAWAKYFSGTRQELWSPSRR